MIDVQKVNATKDRILTMIQTAGPSFPTRVSRETGISPLFVSALLAELVSERKLIMSSMKVGSSPLYLIKGQEALLENFTQYLNAKEKEAVSLLKESRILDDEKLDPALRVALRKVKDFAVPITARIGEEEKLFWKFFPLKDEEAHKEVSSMMKLKTPQQKAPEPAQLAQELIEKVVSTPSVQEKEEIEKPHPKIKKTKEKKESAFALVVKEYLKAKDIELLQEIAIKSKEYHARIRTDTPFGKQEYLLIAKDKKKVTEDDLAIALHKSQTEKMPSLIIAKGDLDKDAKIYLENWKNLIKFEKLKL